MSKYSQSAGQFKFRENKKPHFLLKNEVFLSWRRDLNPRPADYKSAKEIVVFMVFILVTDCKSI